MDLIQLINKTMTEIQIINAVYFLTEKNSTPWDATSDEYLTCEALANNGINRWENCENVLWRDLKTSLADATDGSKTTLVGEHSYDCPSSLKSPASYVWIGETMFAVEPIEKLESLRNDDSNWVYFAGNIKDGYKLKINHNLLVSAGQTIDYEFYRKATLFTVPTSETELSDPYYLVYFIAAFLSETGVDSDFYTMAEARLEAMRTANMSGLWGITNDISGVDDIGFGY